MAVYKSKKELGKRFLEEKKRIKQEIKYVRRLKNVELTPEQRRMYQEHNQLASEYVGDGSDFIRKIKPYKNEKDFLIKSLEGELESRKILLEIEEFEEETKRRLRPDTSMGQQFIGAGA